MNNKRAEISTKDESFYFFGIGTSAGGLETLRKFFNHIPLGFSHSFVIIQHLSPDYKSLTSELLAHNTSMSIYQAKDGMKVKKGSVYLIPPKKNLTILSGILELVKSGIEDKIKDTAATIHTDFSKCRTVKFPTLHLQNILQNLITNALKYKRSNVKPAIEIASRKTKEFVVLTVKDNGTGIDLEQHGKKLFGLFKRFHLNTEGKGIGLYITKSIVENHHGRIEVSSTPGEGTTFKIYFPKEPYIE